MARDPSGPRAARTVRNLTYAVLLALLLRAAVIVFTYGPFSRNKAEPIEITPLPDADIDVNAAEVNETTALLPPAEVRLGPNFPEIAPEPTAEGGVKSNQDAAELITKATALIREKTGRIIEALTTQ